MQTVTLKFDVSGQNLIAGDLTRYASNTVNYVKAVFDLDGNWNSFDSVRAVWSTDFECISTVLDSEGVCYVPQEVLKRTGNVMVNLVGSIAENDELTDRLTTYPVVALVINANAKVCGTETAEVTPSQFEQYVAMVVAEVEKVTGMTATAVALPEGSAPTAVYENGVLTLGIPKGDKGETGNGISSVEFNADYSLTFNFTESEPYTTPSIRGERGAQGYGIVSVEKIGTAGLVDTYQVNYEDPSVPPTTFTVTNGAKGDTGNGISSVTKTGTVGLVDTYRITFTNGGHYDFNVTNGAKGDTGATGNGIATIAKTSTSGLVDTYTITFTDGTSTTFEVTNGQDGEVTYDELSELLPTETASGDIASFNDGQAVIPAVSVVATITPIQSGSGAPSPSNVRPISGHDEVGVGVCGVNFINPSVAYSDIGYNPAVGTVITPTVSANQWTDSGNGVYTISSLGSWAQAGFISPKLPNGTVRFQIDNVQGSVKGGIYVLDSNMKVLRISQLNNPITNGSSFSANTTFSGNDTYFVVYLAGSGNKHQSQNQGSTLIATLTSTHTHHTTDKPTPPHYHPPHTAVRWIW